MASEDNTSRLSDIAPHILSRLLSPITIPSACSEATFRNWAHTFECTPLAIFEPESEYQCELVLELARRQGKTVRAVGSGCSPSDLACTSEYMLRFTKLNKILEVNAEKCYVRVQGGITLQSLHEKLAPHGLAMINVPSISDQTLAGAVSTATHGSGIHYPVLSSHVISLQLLLADGSIVHCSRAARRDLFLASLCGLGSTGLMLSIQLGVEPSFRLKEIQETYDFEYGVENLRKIVSSAQHVRLWWFPASASLRVSYADRTLELAQPSYSSWWDRLLEYHLVQLLLFIARFVLALNPWVAHFVAWMNRERLMRVDDSQKIFNINCRYRQYTTEWAIPYANATACLLELRAWFDQELADPGGLRPHFPVEIRFSAADDLWLSPSNGRQSCWIGIVQYKPYGFNVPYRRLFERFEGIASRYGGRPHWAKAHPLRAHALRQAYPHFDDFVQVLSEVDPNGLFRNEYINRHIFGLTGPWVDDRIFKPPIGL